MRDHLLDRLLFTVAMLVAMAFTTAAILAVAAVARPAQGGSTVRPAATASPAHGG